MKGSNARKNVNKVVRGRRQPHLAEPVHLWRVTAEETNGGQGAETLPFDSVEAAMKHADWWHSHPGLMKVEIHGPEYSGQRHYPTEADRAVGDCYAQLLELSSVPPSVKYKISRWMDSKAWGGKLNDPSV